jgi:hypothetical protein
MLMVGHRTEAIYRRYAIVDEAMLREGAAKLARGEGADLGLEIGAALGHAGHSFGHRQGPDGKRARVTG